MLIKNIPVNLYISSNGNIRAYKTAISAVQVGEIHVKLNLRVPDSAFQKPDFEVNLSIEEDKIPIPEINVKKEPVSDWLKGS